MMEPNLRIPNPHLSPKVRHGLTLIELIVVLVILVAVAGVVVPLLPNMLGRAETATGATSITEVNKAIQIYEQVNMSYPTDWDALTDNSTLFSYVRGGSDLTLDSGLTTNEANALIAAGISRLQTMVSAPANKTFDPYGTADSITNGFLPAQGNKLAVLTTSGKKKLNLNDGSGDLAKYIVLGFGRRATIVGKGVANAPIAFRDEGTLAPDQAYCRFGVVFQVTLADGTPMTKARFVGACSMRDAVFTSDDDLARFYNLNRGG